MSATVVLPTAPRYVATQLGSSLRITLPSRRRWLAIIPSGLFVILWLAIVLIIGSAGVVFVFRALMAGSLAPVEALLPAGFFIIWLSFFSIGGLTALYSVIWNLAGREVIEVSRHAIRLSRVIPGWARTKEYLAEHIRDLRVSPQYVPGFYRYRLGFFGLLGGAHGQLAFDYGARTIRCLDADEAEVKMILAEIRQRFPQYAGAAAPGA